jgi:AcrR family transcriptional regulator
VLDVHEQAPYLFRRRAGGGFQVQFHDQRCTIWYMSDARPGARQSPRERLLAAVVEVALAGGIADKSLRAIAEAAGTSHRMLIHHFGSREGLLVEVIRAVEARQRVVMNELSPESGEVSEDLTARFWKHLRSPELAPQERLFFEVYGQALQGREWAKPLLEGIVEDWVGPVAAMVEAAGADPRTARIIARLSVAVGRGLLLDVLATGDDEEVDAAMQLFTKMLLSLTNDRAGT